LTRRAPCVLRRVERGEIPRELDRDFRALGGERDGGDSGKQRGERDDQAANRACHGPSSKARAWTIPRRRARPAHGTAHARGKTLRGEAGASAHAANAAESPPGVPPAAPENEQPPPPGGRPLASVRMDAELPIDELQCAPARILRRGRAIDL